MARNDAPRRRYRLALAVGLTLATISPLVTAADAVAQAAWDQTGQRVFDLMRAEIDGRQLPEPQAAAALVPVAARPPQPPAAPQVVLEALYGVGGRWTVVLRVDGVRKVYRPGASLPQNGQGRQVEFRLQAVAETCVVLRAPNGKVRSVCHGDAGHGPAPMRHDVLPVSAALSQPLPPGWQR